ncbi:spermidine/putrescine ABC transporter substrate-binding protein [Candidatus Endobugula sertula]|uniref:Putrescine-binding periplasmic protein n=1 Tax=Candidatus Endobugula sertula TaxID=62101 RepID=A0A1D2QM74_9GAMM|nr:spermidine/putrescine ABC transporter substrate-binding protein [Candidatus Endobugula sertula]
MKLTNLLGAAAVLFGSAVYAEGSLNIYNWSGYISDDMVKKFETETGIDVTIDTYDSNDTLLAKLQQGGGGYDIAIATQSFIPIMISEGLIQKINTDGAINMKAILPSLQSPEWDKGNQYSIPYMWGTTNFAVNTSVYKGDINTFKILFEPPEGLQGNINIFDAASEIVPMASIYLGVPLCSEDPTEMQKVLNLLKAQKEHVKTYSSKSGSIREALAAGELYMSSYWSGSAMRTRGLNKDIRYAYPVEGSLAWVDNVVVPKGAKNFDNAVAFIKFLMKPENAAMNSNSLKYHNGIQGSETLFDPALLEAPEMSVPDTSKLYFAKTCGEKATKLVDRIWTNLLQ